MPTPIGHIASLHRYPIKSMAGEPADAADLGWHGLAGDRRLALRRLDDRGGFPWLTASRLSELIRYVPLRAGDAGQDLPTHVRTPEGEEVDLFGPALAQDVGRRFGAPVELVHLNRGIFDEASVSLITAATVAEVTALASLPADVRRFRPNVLIATPRGLPYEEDGWVGGVLSFGDAEAGAAVVISHRDERCAMINLDPDTARPSPELLKAVVKARDNQAGVYASVLRRGRIAVGQPVYFEPGAEPLARG